MNTSRKPDAARLTKAKIVAAAMALLNDEGLDGVSLRKLAGRLGVRAPSLYWHFPDKDALLAAVLENEAGPRWKILLAILAASTTPWAIARAPNAYAV